MVRTGQVGSGQVRIRVRMGQNGSGQVRTGKDGSGRVGIG